MAAVRLWTIDLGFYNLLWGLVLIAGVFIAASGRTAIGETIIVFTCIAHVILGVVLCVIPNAASGRRAGRGDPAADRPPPALF